MLLRKELMQMLGRRIKMEKAKKRHYIYLAGNISEDTRTFEWRERFIELLANEPRVVMMNPCENEFDQGMKAVEEGGLNFVKEIAKRSQKILRAKDYQLIKISSIVIANLELYSPERPMVGTIQELTWAHDVFYVPVLAICGKEDNVYNTHPWVDECCSAKVETVEEAAILVKEFFLEY